MLPRERQRILLEEIARSGTITTSAAATRFGVSEVTIRADLDELHRRGKVVRSHGGAVAAAGLAPVDAFDERRTLHRDAKRRIAAAAAQYLARNELIILDSGTTVHCLAQAVPDGTDLTVLTPALPAAQHLLTVEGVEVRLLGGRLEPAWLQTVGTARAMGLKGVVAQTLFLGTQGVDDDFDLIERSLELAETKRRLIRHARKVILLVDSSKWGAVGASKTVRIDRVDVVITDTGTPPEVLARLRAGKSEIIVV